MRGGRATLVGTETLAGSVIALDTAVRNLVDEGTSLSAAVARGLGEPGGVARRARTAGGSRSGRRAHVVELDDDLRVRRVTRGEGWIEGAAARA